MCKKKILLIITGSIATYKAIDIIRYFKEQQIEINVVTTQSANKLISPLTLSTITGKKVFSNLFDNEENYISHIELAKTADAIVIAPATANFIGKIAHGIADDLASNIIIASPDHIPKIIAPAMNKTMFENRFVQKNIQTLKDAGMSFVDPEYGYLACNEIGYGRLANTETIISSIEQKIAPNSEHAALQKVKILLTLGATREYLDPIRYISNNASGLQGVMLIEELTKTAAEVHAVSANIDHAASIQSQANLSLTKVVTAEEMFKAVKENLPVDIYISTAAVSDYKPTFKKDSKIKKRETPLESIELSENEDILKYVVNSKVAPKFTIVFSVETNPDTNIEDKFYNRPCDILVVNLISDSSKIFGDKQTNVLLFYKKDKKSKLEITFKGKISKRELSKKIIEKILLHFA